MTTNSLRSRPQRGFTILEIMIAVAIIAIVMASVVSGIYTLRLTQRAEKEDSQVNEIGRIMSERIMGANWDWIGRDRPDDLTLTPPAYYNHGAWSWHRRVNKLSPGDLEPMTETSFRIDNSVATDLYLDNLLTSPQGIANPHGLGILEKPTGIPNLKVYVEYYAMRAMDNAFIAADPTAMWKSEMTQAQNIMPVTPQTMDMRTVQDAILVRIVITWDSFAGGNRQHELVFARRK